MNAQQLKNSILQEAIEGRLVPQDPNDEPASVLLDRIRKEKALLVKEGKLKKKDLVETPISEEEIPFEIPESWEWVRLSQISLDSADGPFGSNLKREHYTSNKEVRIIQLSNIGEEGWRDENVKYTTFSHLPSISRSEAFPNDIIIAKMMPAGRAIICPKGDKKYVLSSDAVRFDFSNHLYRKYLYYSINSNIFKDQVYGEVQGITRVRTSLSKLRTYIIPLPPLAEQKRIVEKIEQLLPKVEEYGKAQEALDKLNAELPERLKKSILQEAIEGRLVKQDPNDEPASVLLDRIRKEKAQLVKEGKLKKKDLVETPISEEEIPFEIPESWKWCRLGDAVNVIMGQSPDGNDVFETSEPEDAFEFHQGKICFSDMYIAPSGRWCKLPSRIAETDSLLVCVRAPIGDVNITQRRIGIGRGLACIKGFYKISTVFLYFWMKAHKQNLVDQGTGSTFKAISVDVLKNLPIPLPPLAEQKRIVEKIEELLAEVEKLK